MYKTSGPLKRDKKDMLKKYIKVDTNSGGKEKQRSSNILAH